jgi:hypothetical protein
MKNHDRFYGASWYHKWLVAVAKVYRQRAHTINETKMAFPIVQALVTFGTGQTGRSPSG